jgi:hypothetical protein
MNSNDNFSKKKFEFNINFIFKQILFPLIEFKELNYHVNRIQFTRINNYDTLVKVDQFNNYKFYGFCLCSAIFAYDNLNGFKFSSRGKRYYLATFAIKTYLMTNLYFWVLIYKFGSLKEVEIINKN